MDRKLLLLVVFCLFATVQPTTYFNREEGFFDNVFDGRETPDDYYEVSPAGDPIGAHFDVDLMTQTGYVANFFGTDIQHFRFFDAGFAECDTAAITNTVTGTGDFPTADVATATALANNFCMIVPYLSTTAYTKYHMAVRVVYESPTQFHNKMDLERASAEVNRAKQQWREKFVAKAVIIATWFLEDAAGATNQFQAVVVVGETDTLALETYVLFIFEDGKLNIPNGKIKGFVNGLYTGPPNSLFARVCPEVLQVSTVVTEDRIGLNSNMKCGNPGVYVLPVSGATCDEADQCSLTTPNPNCNLTTVPIDTCTETFYCYDKGNIELHLKFVQPAWPLLQALDYTKFTATGEQELLSYVVSGAEQCIKNFTIYDTETSLGHYTIQIPKVELLQTCGIVYTAATNSVKFAYKLWDGTSNSMMVDRYGQLIVTGECFADDLKQVVTVPVGFDHVTPVTEIARGPRVLECNIIDRPYFNGHIVLTKAKIGRDLWVLCEYDPGTPFNLWADPFGIYVIDGWAANNPEFEHNPAADPWKKSQKFISNGCGVDKTTGALEAIWLENTIASKSFEADPAHHTYAAGAYPDGSPWYLIAGSIQTNKWNKANAGVPVNKLWFKFTVQFCTRVDEMSTCLDNCPSDPSRRRRSVNGIEEMETLYTSLELEDDDKEPTGINDEPQRVEDESCTSFQTAVTTMAVLLAMLVIAVTLCILIMLKWVNTKNKAKKSSNMKKVPT